MTLALILMFAVSPMMADELPAPFSADYVVEGGGIKVAEMRRQLRREEGGGYVFETTLRSTGVATLFQPHLYVERSVWKAEGGRLVPLSFEAHYDGGDRKVRERDLFHWERGVVESSRKGEPRELPLTAEVMDKQLYQFALRRDMARGAREVVYRVADRGKVRDYRFELQGEETLKTPIGELRTVRLVKGDTTVWLAPSLDYELVRIAKEENGVQVTSYITRIER